MRDFPRVWDVATNNEEAELAPELLKKKNAYLKKGVQRRIRSTREGYRRLVQMFANDGPSVTQIGTDWQQITDEREQRRKAALGGLMQLQTPNASPGLMPLP